MSYEREMMEEQRRQEQTDCHRAWRFFCVLEELMGMPFAAECPRGMKCEGCPVGETKSVT